MPRTEDDGHLLSISGLQRGQEVTHALHPTFKFLVRQTVGQYLLHNSRVSDIPSRSFGELLSGITTAVDSRHRITRMPTQGHDTTAQVVGNDLFGHTGEGHTVKVLLVAHLNTTQVETHNGGIVAADVLHVARVFLIFPGQTVHRVVLVAIHNTFLLK